MLAFAISLVSGLSYGISDFIGGLQARRLNVLAVLVVSQPAGLAVGLVMLPVFGGGQLEAGDALLAAAGGASSLVALGAFYRALAIGTMSVVAPIAATGVVVPVAYGIAGGESPGTIQLAGIIVAITGVIVLSREEGDGAEVSRASIWLALASAVGFGVFFTIIDIVAEGGPGWTIVWVRVGAVALIIPAFLIARPPAAGREAMPALFAMAFFDVMANGLFAVASTKGLLPLVAVGGSTYPAFTILLAHLILGERLVLAQRLGVVAALAGVGLIAAGG